MDNIPCSDYYISHYPPITCIPFLDPPPIHSITFVPGYRLPPPVILAQVAPHLGKVGREEVNKESDAEYSWARYCPRCRRYFV